MAPFAWSIALVELQWTIFWWLHVTGGGDAGLVRFELRVWIWESFRVKPGERELNQGNRGKRRGDRAQGVLDRILGKNRRKTSHRRQKRDWSVRRETERTSQKPVQGLFKAEERSEASSTMESHRGRGLDCFGNWAGGSIDLMLEDEIHILWHV